MQLRALHIPAALVVAGIAMSVSGAACIQPEDTFTDFEKRYDAIEGEDAGESVATAAVSTGVEGCVPPGPESRTAGTYIFALSAQLANNKPIFLRADVTFGDPATDPSVSMVLTPLGTPYIDTGTAPFTDVPPSLSIGPFPLDAQGQFSAQLPLLAVGGGANSITGANLEATVKIENGQFCEVNEGVEPAVVCGNISGNVSEPIELELKPEKNFYAMTKYEGPTPTDPTLIQYNCAGEKGKEP